MSPGRHTEPLPYLLTLVAVFALGVVVGTGFDSEPPAQPTPTAAPVPVERSYLAPELDGVIEPADVYHGNTRSRVFHRPSCRHYDCLNCTRVFTSRDEAIRAGYRPGGNCRP